MKSLLELYKCKDFQELYEKLKTGETPELYEELNRVTDLNKIAYLTNSSDAMDLLNRLDISQGDYLLLCNSKGYIEKIVRLEERINEMKNKDLFELLYINHTPGCLLFTDAKVDQEKINVFRASSMKIVDEFSYIDFSNMVYSKKADCYYDYGLIPESEISELVIDSNDDFNKMDVKVCLDYMDFVEFYINNEIIDTSIDYAKCIINITLSGLYHEYSFIAPYDNKYKVKDFKIINTGDQTGCYVDTRRIFYEMKGTKYKGLVFGHNHPSTIAEPSNEDIMLDAQLSLVAASLNKEFCNIICGSKVNIIQGKENFRKSQNYPEPELDKDYSKTEEIITNKEEALPPIEAMRDM